MRQTKHPIYIISKGRQEARMTSRTLEEIGLDYKIAIEPQEYDQYAAVIDPKKILVTPFSNLKKGSIPVRNFIWEHSIQNGHEAHWCLDDNIRYFYRLHMNTKLRVRSSAPLTVVEDYYDRFENVGMAGLNYHYFAPTHVAKEPVYFNTRIYSCILIRNDMPYRWRVLECDGKDAPYNEDTDLSLQCLKGGYGTFLLNSFLCGKAATGGHQKGGNAEEVYKYKSSDYDNRYAFAASLAKAHPDVVQITQKHGRWHHQADYSKFQKFNQLRLKPGVTFPSEYPVRLKLVTLDDPDNFCSTYKDGNIEDLRMEMDD